MIPPGSARHGKVANALSANHHYASSYHLWFGRYRSAQTTPTPACRELVACSSGVESPAEWCTGPGWGDQRQRPGQIADTMWTQMPNAVHPKLYIAWLSMQIELFKARHARNSPIRTIRLGRTRFLARNSEEAIRIYYDIFRKQDYSFTTKVRRPFIIDCGAHIGIASFYFKQRYPDARILAIEANPQNVELLLRNLELQAYEDVEVVSGAVSDHDGDITFYVSADDSNLWTWADTTVRGMAEEQEIKRRQEFKQIIVPSIRLSTLIDREVDLLKIDIEGAEMMVLPEIQGKLRLVKELVMELHGTDANLTKNLEITERLLTGAGYTLKLKRAGVFFIIHAKR